MVHCLNHNVNVCRIILIKWLEASGECYKYIVMIQKTKKKTCQIYLNYLNNTTLIRQPFDSDGQYSQESLAILIHMIIIQIELIQIIELKKKDNVLYNIMIIN